MPTVANCQPVSADVLSAPLVARCQAALFKHSAFPQEGKVVTLEGGNDNVNSFVRFTRLSNLLALDAYMVAQGFAEAPVSHACACQASVFGNLGLRAFRQLISLGI